MNQSNTYSPRKSANLQAWVDNRIQQNRPFVIRGSNSRCSESDLDVLSTRNLKEILFFDADDMVIGAQAGIRARDLQSLINQKKMFLPFNPWYPDSTIGSIVACNDSGANRMNGGGLRDSIIGIEYINGKGELVKAGGRVVKNVTGYDLSRMMLGSRGGLGVITAVNFKVLPRPPGASALYFTFTNNQWLAKVKELQEKMIPLDWVEAISTGSADWIVGIGFSGIDVRQKRIEKDLRAIFSGNCEVLPEGKTPGQLAVLPGQQRFFGFLPDVLRPLRLGKAYLHLYGVVSTAEMLDQTKGGAPLVGLHTLVGAHEGRPCAIVHPIGGDFHLIHRNESVEFQKKLLTTVKNQLENTDATLSLINSAPGLGNEYLEGFAIPKAYSLMKSLKRKLDPAAVFHAPFYELDEGKSL